MWRVSKHCKKYANRLLPFHLWVLLFVKHSILSVGVSLVSITKDGGRWKLFLCCAGMPPLNDIIPVLSAVSATPLWYSAEIAF